MSLLDSLSTRKRRSPGKRERRLIFAKTGGLCHICGGKLDEKWSADHVQPVGHGGESTTDNFLPACHACNRLKWGRPPEEIRLILQLGTYARKEIQRDTPLGRQIASLFRRRENLAIKRRKAEPSGPANPSQRNTLG